MANQLTGLYMMATLAFNQLISLSSISSQSSLVSSISSTSSELSKAWLKKALEKLDNSLNVKVERYVK